MLIFLANQPLDLAEFLADLLNLFFLFRSEGGLGWAQEPPTRCQQEGEQSPDE